MYRRDLNLFLQCLRSAFVLLILLVTLCALAAGAIVRHVGEAYTPVHVAIVDNEDSVFSRILVRAVGKMEYISGLLLTERMREADAREALREGRCAAVIILPDGFTEDITHGRQTQGTIILSPAVQSQATLVASVARFGERMLMAGQYGVFCGERLLGAYRMPASAYDRYYAAANGVLLGEATGDTGRYFRVETVEYLDTAMTSEGYFALWWAVTVLFLCSLFFIPLFTADCTRPMLSRLAALGVRNVAFLRWKFLFAFLLRLFLLAVGVFLLCRLGIADMRAQDVGILAAVAAYITVIGASLTLCFGNAVTANIMFSVAGLFLCGGLVPRQLLPAWLVRLGEMTPFGAAGNLLAPVFGGRWDPIGICTAFLWCVGALLLMGVYLNRVRTGKGAGK